MFACIMVRADRKAPQSYATPEVLLEALAPFGQDDLRGHWTNERALLVQAKTWNTPQSRHEATPEICAQTGRVIVSWVRLDNRATLCADLGLTDGPTLTDPQIILAAHLAWAADCADRLEGDFSFVIYDPETHEVYCARDAIGTKPLFYYCDDRVFIAATTAAVFEKLSQVSIARSRAWMARYMADAPHPMTESAFDGVARLAPAHCLQVDQDGTPSPRAYFAFQDTAPFADQRDPAHVEAYRDAFHRATEARLRSDFLVAAESSGGLDSSSIVGHAVHHLPHSIDDFHCFGSYILEQDGEYLLDTALHCGVRHSHITTHQNGQTDSETLDRILRVMGHPAEHEMAEWHAPIMQNCAGFGARTLLSGYGGDEMVTQAARHLYVELYHNRQFKTLAHEMHGNALTRWVRFGAYLRRMARAGTSGGSEVIPSFVDPLIEAAMLHSDVTEEFNLRRQSAAGYLEQRAARTLNAHTLLDPAFTPRRVARLEACTLLAQTYKVDYRWPLYDRALMQQYLKTPAIEKRHKTMGRYLHRRAVAGTIPDKITWKQSKDLGGVAVPRGHEMIPEALTPDTLPPRLGDLLDIEKVQQIYTEVTKAASQGPLDGDAIRKVKGLQRAWALVRWEA